MKLSDRLYAIATFVPKGGRVADIGTDHGYLPVWLMKNGAAKCVTATDIREEPLKRAMSAALMAGETGIAFMRSDGLKELRAEDYDTLVIAGMGGETITKIISESGWDWADSHRLVLQPMSKIPELIEYLYENSFFIIDEKLVRDKNAFYRVLLAGRGKYEMPDLIYRHIGQALINRRDPLLIPYLSELISKTEKALAGIQNSKDICKEKQNALNNLLHGFLAMKERLSDGKTEQNQ